MIGQRTEKKTHKHPLRRWLGALLAAAVLWVPAAWAAEQTADPNAPPAVEAQAFVLMSAQTGQVFLEGNMHQQLPMASTTKIMTALLAVENGSLDTVYTMRKEDVTVEGSSLGVREGDQLTLRDLITGMMLKSGNDAARSVAHIVGGDGFVDMMNQRAAQLGMRNTHFTNPAGLPDDDHYSTAYDMALLAKAALQNPDFAAICASSTAAITVNGDTWHLKNSNRLLRELDGACGIKTGFTKKAGRCLVSAVTREGSTLICVTLNCGEDWKTHTALYDYAFATGSTQQLPPEEKSSLPVVGGSKDSVQITVQSELDFLLLKEGSSLQKTVQLPGFIYAPITAGQVVGEVVYRSPDGGEYRLPVTATEEVPEKGKKTGDKKKTGGIFDWIKGWFVKD
ncbi:D-alanyl-D-alanine carboxypeptidase [Neobittarella massiliensis]|uniref:serine-type D-Ala-D-Ala carboxypeptidase n=1 Tax=Neobittarella massiliensis (ex Bilen et al. 2018) TaxID=2041842 RepID=A0A8J6IL73_9FIRM|nr:D-alanyl-D-alanine carboxypeptidase family protein [Neobittarella massiliensis]MBC3515499.1 D-alanyl-D-alanine carboxypeptidase [Neobittarella massiliensis]